MRALQVKEMWPACVISEGALAKALKGLGTNSNGDWARGTPGQYFPPSHLRKQLKIGYNTMGNVVIEGNS